MATAWKRVVILLLALLAACGSPAPAVTQAPDPLASTSWYLEALNGQAVDVAAGITLAFSAGGTLNGSDGCNDYTAGYTVSGTEISILAPVGTTRKACPEDVLQRSTAYVTALSQAASYTIEGDRLNLLASDGTPLASLLKIEPQ